MATENGPRISPASAYLARLAPSSRYRQRRALATIAAIIAPGWVGEVEFFPWERVNFAVASAVRAELVARGYAPQTTNRLMSALRGACQGAWSLGLMDAETLKRIESVPLVRGERLPSGRALASTEVAALLGGCDRATLIGRRDAAALAILLGAGLRRAELVSLNLSDYDVAEGLLRVRHAKGNREREVPLPAGARAAVDDYLQLRGYHEGPLIMATEQTGIAATRAKPDGRMNPDSVLYLLRRAAKRAGVAHCRPHDLRRTYATRLLSAGADLATVSKLMGHASPVTTIKYDRRELESKRSAVALLEIPYSSEEIDR